MQKAFYSLFIGSLVASSLAWAEDPSDGNELQKEESGQEEGSNEEVPGYRVFMASQLKDKKRLCVTGEVLFWKASEDQLSYATTSSDRSTIRHGHVQSPHFSWDWGFRVGFGYNMPHDHWDLYANYTHFHTHAHGSSSTSTGAVYPNWQAPFGDSAGGYATQATANWRLHLDLADLELGKALLVGRWLSIRPFIGVRGAWIYQKYEIDYKGGTAVPAGDEDQINMQNNCWGVGVRTGIDTLWGLGKGISIFGDGAISLLSGHFNIHQKEQLEEAGTTIVNISSHPTNAITIAELSMGLQYDRFFKKNRYHFGVKLGYEFNYFFDQNQWIRFLNSDNPGVISSNNGNLSLQGVTLGFRFDF
jgi:hypothetical protein